MIHHPVGVVDLERAASDGASAIALGVNVDASLAKQAGAGLALLRLHQNHQTNLACEVGRHAL